MITIRQAGIDELTELVRLNRTVQALHAAEYPELFREEPPFELVEASFRKLMESETGFWLMASASKPCGYLFAEFRERPESWIRYSHKVCNISQLSVEPEFQRQGVAKGLVARLRQEAAARGFERIELDVWSFNAGAKASFERLGFRVFNERMAFARRGER